jgi:FtsZ-binding cell division protein ZapB
MDINTIKLELDNRFEKIVEHADTILKLKIEIKELEIVNLKLKQENVQLNAKLAPRYSLST